MITTARHFKGFGGVRYCIYFPRGSECVEEFIFGYGGCTFGGCMWCCFMMFHIKRGGCGGKWLRGGWLCYYGAGGVLFWAIWG